jgi:hypothetical protein
MRLHGVAVFLRKQEPRVSSDTAYGPGLLLSQEHKVAETC